MTRAVWGRRGLALLMGALIGVDWSAPRYPWAPLSIGVVIVTLPVALTALRYRAIRRSARALAGALAPPLLLVGFVVFNALNPTIWQAYTNDAPYISMAAVIALTPGAAAFTLCAWPPEPERAFIPEAFSYALLAWFGVGVQNLALTYLIPIAAAFWSIATGHVATTNGSGLGLWPVLMLVIAAVATAIWLAGFGLAALEGAMVGILLDRLRSNASPIPAAERGNASQ